MPILNQLIRHGREEKRRTDRSIEERDHWAYIFRLEPYSFFELCLIYNKNKLRELGIARIEKSSIELNRVRKTGSEMAGLAGNEIEQDLLYFGGIPHIEEASRTRNIRLKTRQEEGQ